MNKIKKLYPLIVGVVLLVSVAAYGTRAYFSDSTNLDSNIELTLGDVNINSDSSQVWKYAPLEEAYNDQLKDEIGATLITETTTLEKSEQIMNVRPGDAFTKDYKFTNEGSLSQKISFKSNKNDLNNDDSIFNVEWLYKDKDNDIIDTDDNTNPIILTPNTSITATMKISVKTNGYDGVFGEKQNNETIPEYDFIGETVTVEAVQTNYTVATE
ncbi:hypothetical protein [Desemzia sp. FAM 23991]|uniref:hypothetical protein n=1 Tax=unclassified Desemzia TaxID=2685243 RepID=UPI00388663D4